MGTQANEVQAIYNRTARQQDTGRFVVEVMTKEDHAAMHEMARLDIGKIAQAVDMIPKRVCIAARRGNRVARQQQEAGLEQLNEMLRVIRETGDKAEAIKWGMVAAGYANGMCCGDLISKSELHEVIGLIDQTYKRQNFGLKLQNVLLGARYQKVGAGMSAPQYRRIVAVDFDGTLAVTKFPEIIKPIPKMIKHCKQLQKDGVILILYTCRKGQDLQDAVEWCKGQGLVFDYVNENTAENIANYGGTDTRKIFAHEYIDDKAMNPVREAMWARRVRQLYASRIISAVGLAAALVIAIEAMLTAIKFFT